MSTQLEQTSFARGIELWRPESDGALHWMAGAYQDMPQFEAASRQFTFAKGEGLPGLAWSHRAPMIMHNLQSGQFLRSAAASEVGLECGVALPFFRGKELRGVLVLLLESSEAARGAIEIWRPNDRRELGLSESYYANLEQFARLSQFVKFPCGAGLPGQIWQTRCPKVIDQLGTSPAFVRGSGARADRLTNALGVPFMRSAWDLESVALLMSSDESPLARTIEVWIRDEDELRLHSQSGADTPGFESSQGANLAREVWSAEAPVVLSEHAENGLNSNRVFGAGFPVFVGETLVAVVTLIG